MRRRFAREILFLCLPVVVLAGVAFLRSPKSAGVINVSNPFDRGPIRLECSEFEPDTLSPIEVESGFTWAAVTTVSQLGSWDVPPTWKLTSSTSPFLTEGRLLYKWGKDWKEAPATSDKKRRFFDVFLTAEKRLKVKVNLEGVPRDATEIRMRGRIEDKLSYIGPLTRGWKKPDHLEIGPTHQVLTIKSTPFDVLIKGPNDLWPEPVVSRTMPLSFVKAFYVQKKTGLHIFLQLRQDPKFGAPEWRRPPELVSYSLQDKLGKDVNTCLENGTGDWYSPVRFDIYRPELLDEKFPSTDMLMEVLSGEAACGGWQKYQGPFTLELKLSEANTWPLTVRVPVLGQRPVTEGEFPFR